MAALATIRRGLRFSSTSSKAGERNNLQQSLKTCGNLDRRISAAHTLVLMRHGQSTWNLENRFTGWVDVPLTDLGKTEAARGGKALKAEGFQFDIAYTSVLKRAIKVRQMPFAAPALRSSTAAHCADLLARAGGARSDVHSHRE